MRWMLAVAVLAALPTRSSAEPRATAGVRVGVDAGWRADNETELDQTLQLGWVGGLVGAYRFSEYFAVDGGALYVEKGWRLESIQAAGPGGIYEVEPNTELGYLELPLHAVGRLPFTEVLTGRLFAGPSLGILLTGELTGPTVNGPRTVDIADDGDTFEWSATVGAGLEWQLSSAALAFDLTYCHGLTTVDFVATSPVLPSERMTYMSLENRTLMLTTELRFLTFHSQ